MCQVMGVKFPKHEQVKLDYDEHCPKHYLGDGYITCTLAMESAVNGWINKSHTINTIWWWCCAFKYIWRCLSKGQTLSDIDKAIDCLQKLRKEVEPVCSTSHVSRTSV